MYNYVVDAVASNHLQLSTEGTGVYIFRKLYLNLKMAVLGNFKSKINVNPFSKMTQGEKT